MRTAPCVEDELYQRFHRADSKEPGLITRGLSRLFEGFEAARGLPEEAPRLQRLRTFFAEVLVPSSDFERDETR